MKRYHLIGLAFVALLIVVAVIPETVFAQAPQGGPGSGVVTDPQKVFGPVMGFIMSLMAWLLTMAGVLLNQAVQITVVEMGTYVNGLQAIEVVWRVLRDLGNIILIFGFIAIGITTILNVNWYGGGTKMLPTLLIAAIFLNFSLFVAEAVVDVGNLFGTQIYAQINGGTLSASGGVAGGGISDTVMNQIGLQTLMKVNRNTTTGLFDFSLANILTGFLGILLFMIAAFVFFSLAFMLISRFVILILLIMVSPLGFAGLAVPKLEGVAHTWWDTLFRQALTAPVLLLTLYVALKVITDDRFIGGFFPGGAVPANVGDAYTGISLTSGSPSDLQQFAGVALSFVVAMGLLMACVVIAKQMSAFGASWATKTAGTVMGGIFGYGLAGGTSVLGRTIGGGLGLAMSSRAMRARAAKSRGAAAAVTVGKFLSNRTYDIRNVKAVAGAGGAVVRGVGRMAPGSDFESIAESTGKGATLTAAKADETARNLVKTYGVGGQYYRDQQAEYEAAAAKIELGKAEAEAKSTAPGTRARQDADSRVSQAFSKMSGKEISELKGIRQGQEALVRNLSPQQFEALMKSDSLNEGEKAAIAKARYSDLGAIIAAARSSGNTDELDKKLSLLSKGELEAMPSGMLTSNEVLENLTDKQREVLNDSNQRTAQEKQLVRASSKTGRIETAFDTPARGAGGAAAAPMLNRLSPQQVAKLPKRILTDGHVAQSFTPAQLNAIQKEDKLDPTEIARIKLVILSGGRPAAQAHVNNPLNAWYWS